MSFAGLAQRIAGQTRSHQYNLAAQLYKANFGKLPST